MKFKYFLLIALFFGVGVAFGIGDIDRIEDYIDSEIGAIDDYVDTEVATCVDGLEWITTPYATTNFLDVTVEHAKADSVWSTIATHEVFDVTGMIAFYMIVYDSVALQGGDSIIVEMGANKIWAALKNDWDAGELALGPSPSNFIAGAYSVYNPATSATNCGVVGTHCAGAPIFHGFSNGIDIGYEVQTNTIVNAGITRWLIYWRALSANAAVAAGAGGTL